MSKRVVVHVKPTQGDKWKVEKSGGAGPGTVHETKPPAVKEATSIAKQADLGQVKIHKRDGTIQEERTFGKDPHPPKG